MYYATEVNRMSFTAKIQSKFRNLLSVKIHFLTNVYHIWSHLDNTSLYIDYPVESCKISVILFGSMLPNVKGH